MSVSPRILVLLVLTHVATIGALVYLVATRAGRPTARFEEIDVERINVVSPAGKTVIAISNQERIAPPAMGGKTYPVAVSDGRARMAGMIFFNQDGDEMGGLVFNSFRRPDGKAAGIGHLSFDRFQDNQVVALQYKENASTVQSGLTLYDRPSSGTFKTSLDLLDESRAAAPERAAEIHRELAGMSERQELGVERVFLGSKDKTAQLVLRDSKGRVRARLLIDASDEAKLEFLDDASHVTARFPS